MSEFYGPGDERESIRTIHRALEAVLTPKDLSRMDRAFPAGSAKGDRYSEPAMRALTR